MTGIKDVLAQESHEEEVGTSSVASEKTAWSPAKSVLDCSRAVSVHVHAYAWFMRTCFTCVLACLVLVLCACLVRVSRMPRACLPPFKLYVLSITHARMRTCTYTRYARALIHKVSQNIRHEERAIQKAMTAAGNNTSSLPPVLSMSPSSLEKVCVHFTCITCRACTRCWHLT